MLNGSILGAVYRCWTGSAAFAFLQRLWRAVAGGFRRSRILRAAFGPTRLDDYFSGSVCARLFRRLLDGVMAICRAVAGALRGSAVCSFLAPAVRSSVFLDYEFLFGLFCCVMFLVPHERWNNLWAVIFAAAFLALYLLRCAAGGETPVYPDVLGPGLALFLLSCAVSMAFTTAPENSLHILLLFAGAFVMCWLIAAGFDNPRSLRRLLGFLYLCMLLESGYGILQRLLNLVDVNYLITDVTINEGVPGRVYASLYNPNNLSAFLQLFLPLGAAYAAGADRAWKRTVLGLGLLLPVAALVMTYSRSGWLSVMLAAAVFLYFTNKRLLPLLFVVGLLAVPLLPQSVLTRFSTIFNSRDTSRNHRLAIWQGVLDLLADRGHWLTGIGLGPESFLNVYPEYAYANGRLGAYHSQMMYLELFLETGVVGFVSFMWALLKYAGRIGRGILRGGGRANRMILVACAASFAGLAVSFLVEYTWFYQRIIFAYFIFFGVTVAALRISERGGGGACAG